MLPALAELYGVTVDDILAGGEPECEGPHRDTPARWRYVRTRASLALDIAFVPALLLTFTCMILYAQRVNSHPWGGTYPLSMMLGPALLAIGAMLALYPLSDAPAALRADICRQTALRFSVVLSFHLVSLSSLFPRLLVNTGLYGLHWAAAAAIAALWASLSRTFGPLLTSGRRWVFAAAVLCLLLSDGPAACFFLPQPDPAAMGVARFEAAVCAFSLADPILTCGGLLLLAAAAIWQIISDRRTAA